MQTSVLALVVTLAGALAQDINSLPACERSCITSVVNIGPSFGCPADNGQSDPACLCSNANFAYAIRDCSTESCPEGTDVAPVNNYGIEYCSSAQATASGSNFAALGIFSSGAAESVSSASATTTSESTTTESSSSESRRPITTIPVISTITSGTVTEETTLGSTTIYAGETLSTGDSSRNSTESASATTTRPVVSTVTEASTTRETTVGSTTESSTPTSSSSKAAGATLAPRMAPVFKGRQGTDGAGSWVVPVVGWTAGVVGLAQLMW